MPSQPAPAAAPVPTAELPIGFAHRGGVQTRRLQNTLVAFRRSRELGAGGIESDVALTADGVPVLIHRGILARLRRPVSALRRDQLPAHVPSLEDVYRDCGPTVHVALDMAAPGAVAAVVDIARRLGDPSRLWLTYWRVDTLAAWREMYPDVRLVFPTLVLRASTAAQRCARLRSAGVDAVNLFHRSCPATSIAAAHEAGLLVFAWGARTGPAATRALRRGTDGVFCDDTVGMAAAVERERRRRLSAAG